MKRISLLALASVLALAGCQHGQHGQRSDCDPYGGQGHRGARNTMAPGYDRPFPIGQVTDSFWETQQTNAEAADFIFYDHEFRGNTAELGPAAKKHLEQVALRIEHVPFPIVIEQSPRWSPEDSQIRRNAIDQSRRQMIVEQLARMGVVNVQERVIVANAFNRPYTEQEAEGAYYRGILNGAFGGGAGRRFGGTGGAYR